MAENISKQLQLLRNKTAFETVEDAVKGLAGKLTNAPAGCPAIAIYDDGILFGVASGVAGKYQIFEGVSVDAETGKISVPNSVKDAIEAAIADADVETAIADAINAELAKLNVTKAENTGKFATSVTQNNGKIAVDYIDAQASDVKADAVSGNDKIALEEGTVASQLAELAKALKGVSDNAAKYEIEKITEGLPETISERYRLVSFVGDGEKTPVAGASIDIPKDVHLINVVGAKNGQAIKFTYTLSNGSTKEVEIDLKEAIFDSEVGDGLHYDSETGVISVQMDEGSESFLSVSDQGIKLAGVQDAIDAAASAEIAKLDSEKESSDGVKVKIKVTQVDGKITAVNVTETDIASAADLAAEITRATTEEGKLDTAVKAAATAVTTEKERAEGAESNLSEAIDGVKGRLTTAETEITGIKTAATALADAVQQNTEGVAANLASINTLKDAPAIDCGEY